MVSGLTVEFEGEDALYASLRAKADRALQRLVNKVDELDNELADKIRLNLTDYLQVRTGKGLGSVQVETVSVIAGTVMGGVTVGGPDAPYLRVQEVGSEGSFYPIVPVNKNFLSFVLDGKRIFTKLVNHPPIKATHFVQSAVDDMGDIEARLNEALKE
jgi:hypothetical protein